MYLQILKKDLKRKKTMNVILFLFILLAVTFIAGGVNNMASVLTALDSYFERAGVPDFCFAVTDKKELEAFRDLADRKNYSYDILTLYQTDPKNIEINGKEFNYTNTTTITGVKNKAKVFDEHDREITEVRKGDIYISAQLFYSDDIGIKKGDKMTISIGNRKKEFTVKGCTKDAMFGSEMIGMTRMIVNDDELDFFKDDDNRNIYFSCVYGEIEEINENITGLMLNTLFTMDGDKLKLMYLMDLLKAAVMLIVSICLILISMVMLHFTIRFTISEEFREIGVMKAIGIPNWRIRGLYITKYFMISTVGTVLGFLLSIVFGDILIYSVSRNIIMQRSGLWLNLVCAMAAGMAVVGFCYLCTGKVKTLSPISAIRNGESGERFSKKGILSLSKSRFRPAAFMAINDIFSGLRRFLSMILIFALGILMIIIPVNAINTLQSDNLISWFNMALCDHVLEKEVIFNDNAGNKEKIEDKLQSVRGFLDREGIKADVFQEVMFRMNISRGEKRMNSLAFIGVGDVKTDQYSYLEGTPPEREGEVAITGVVAEHIGADIGDDVKIKNGEETRTYTVTAINQSMNNMGEGIRFYQNEKLDFSYAAGTFGIQVRYLDTPDGNEKEKRLELLNKHFTDCDAYVAGDYVNHMIGDAAGQFDSVRQFIILIVMAINILVTVLMIKSFITKEKGEIGMLKAIGFRNGTLIAWQSIRIGIVIILAAVIAALLSTPLSQVSVGSVFQMMGASKIKFAIKPLEVYVVYPLLMLVVTVGTAMLTATQIFKISPSETSNME